jgi:hypothetical protein
MWSVKQSDHIIYIDRQTLLEVPPTMFCDNEQTPFKDDMFDTIFYDPPHKWGDKGSYFSYPNKKLMGESHWKDKAIPRYYGWEIYDTRAQLIKHIYNAQKEFHRIGKIDCLLWFKWNEINIPLNNILTVMTDWQELITLYVNDPSQTRGSAQTYWVVMQKKAGATQELLFSNIPASYDSSVARFNPSKP